MTGDPWSRFVELVPERFREAMFRTDAAYDAILACMARGWSLEALAVECTPPDAGAGAGVIIARLRDATHKRPPRDETAGPWLQPLPWCGRCDNARTRWLELVDLHTGKPTGSVIRCPTCYTDPPNSSRYPPRCVACGTPTRLRDLSGRPTCGRCLS